MIDAYQSKSGNTVKVNTTEHNTYQTNITRYLQGNQDSSALRSNALTRLLTLRTDASYLPIGNSLTTSYHLESRRDMLIHREGFIGNVGTEVGRNQTMTMAWVPRRVLFLNPNISLTGTYREDAGSGVRVNSSDPLGLKNIGNTGSLRATTTIPFSRFANQTPKRGMRRFAGVICARLGSPASGRSCRSVTIPVPAPAPSPRT